MAWTAGEDVSTGDLITAARWNNYMGASGSLDFVHDALDDVSQSDVSGSRSMDTVYQNTNGKIRIATVAVQSVDQGVGLSGLVAYCDSSNPPTTVVGKGRGASTDHDGYNSVTFVVPINYYYKCHGGYNIESWIEWDLL
jgi:hypothetical protein